MAIWSSAESPPKALQLAITSRIKILAGLNIAERRVPQDGRFRIRVMGKEVDLRISILPTSHGEKVVIRILDKSALAGSVDTLGMDEETVARFRKAIDAPHGMILVTGPTGSGKTTTLYSVLQELNSPELQHRDGRGPDRVRAHGREPGRGPARYRARFCLRASLDSPPGPRHRDGR